MTDAAPGESTPRGPDFRPEVEAGTSTPLPGAEETSAAPILQGPPPGDLELHPQDEERLQEAIRRKEIVEEYRARMAKGESSRLAAKHVRVSRATLCRWDKAEREQGLAGLKPRTDRCGRRSTRLTDEEARAGRALAVQTDSVALAATLLAERDDVREEVVPRLLKPTPTVRRQLTPTEELRNLYRGPKKARLDGYWQPRSLTYEDENGQVRELEPGDLFERDDMTVNFAWWVDWPWGGDRCSDRFGVRLMRGQLLVQIDVASLRVVTFELLARRQDSYRMDDIWQWMGRGYRDCGMPRIGERLERGVWEGSDITGKRPKLKDDGEVAEGHTPTKARIGGLQALGIRIIRSYSPTTKIIENRFNRIQAIQSLIRGQVGRKRGEMERENRLWMRCREGREDPRNHFVSVEEATESIEQGFAWLNAQKVSGRVYNGVPDERWSRGVQARPLRQLEDSQAWLFARDRRQVSIRRGIVQVRLGDRVFFWSNPERFAQLGTGYPVVVYFDSLQPTTPAVIVDGKAGAGAGRVLCVAEAIKDVPQFRLTDEVKSSDASGYARRKAFAEAVRTEYRALGMGRKKGARMSEAKDNQGRLARVDANRSEPVNTYARQAAEEEERLARTRKFGRALIRAANQQEPTEEETIDLR